ncbi:MAG: hydrogen peroxide-inducible genes activator [Gammaproteobacteria bacterium]|nr:hydrogen peroxide-inducible genes activator [Gammaproteobacteria bacterium]
MTLTELRYIVTTAQERHFGRSAEKCFVSQPTLSVAIKKLEDELGVKIFERGVRNVTITAVGERIIEQARKTLEQAATIKDIAKAGTDELVGPLRLGAIHTIGPYLLPDLIPNVIEMAPDVPLVVEENYTNVLAERLEHGELDAIIVALPFDQSGVMIDPLYQEPFVLVFPTAHPLAHKKALTVDLLRDETLLVLGPGHCLREQVMLACPWWSSISTDRTQRVIEGSSLETIRHMVASGIGVSVLPCTAAGADKYSERLITIRRFPEPVRSRKVVLAWRRGFPRPRAIAMLVQAISASASSCVKVLTKKTRHQ